MFTWKGTGVYQNTFDWFMLQFTKKTYEYNIYVQREYKEAKQNIALISVWWTEYYVFCFP